MIDIHVLQKKPTPYYLYDLEKLKSRIHRIKTHLPFSSYSYSIKTNPHPQILNVLRELDLSLDAASVGELKRALVADFSPSHIYFGGPGKSKEDLRFALENHIENFVIESLQEAQILNELAQTLEVRPHVFLRVSPSEFYNSSGRVQRNLVSQFGFSEDLLEDTLTELPKLSLLKVKGLHAYYFSQHLHIESIVKNFSITLKLFQRSQDVLDSELEKCLFGPGLGVAYFKGQEDLNLLELGQELQNQLKPLPSSMQEKVVLEGGRYFVADSAVFVTQVLYTKTSFGQKIAILDGGYTQFAAGAGSGQLLARNWDLAAVTARPLQKTFIYSLYGPSCYNQDKLADQIELPELSSGDFIVFKKTGAYGKTFSPIHFLNLNEAQEIFEN